MLGTTRSSQIIELLLSSEPSLGWMNLIALAVKSSDLHQIAMICSVIGDELSDGCNCLRGVYGEVCACAPELLVAKTVCLEVTPEKHTLTMTRVLL